MQTRRMVMIDRMIGLPLVWLLRPMVWLAGRLLQREHRFPSGGAKRIVVAKFMGMGSILQATPMLRALRRANPGAEIVFLTAIGHAQVVGRLPMIDRVIAIDASGAWRLAWSTVRALAWMVRRPIDAYFDLEVYSFYGALMCLLSLARNRLGFARYSATFKRGMHTHLVYFNTRVPVRRLYLDLAVVAGAPGAQGDDDALESPRLDDAESAAALSAAGIAGRRYVVVNPNASELLLERRWPAESFARLIEQLVTPELAIVLVGDRREAAHVATVKSMLTPAARQAVIDTAGRLTLVQLMAVIRGADCVVTNDTGPMHLSLAFDRPTVCLFGPVDPAHYGAQGPHRRVLYHAVSCSPCAHEISRPPCYGDNLCMKLITIDEVLAATRELLDPPKVAAMPLTTLALSMAASGTPPPGLIVGSSLAPAGQRPCAACGERDARLQVQRGELRIFACRRCGLQQQEPQPTDARLASIYGGEYYNSWGIQEHEDATRQMKMAYFRRQLRRLSCLKPGDRVLDCGTATGYFMMAAAEAGFDPYGNELSDFGANAIARHFGADHVFGGDFSKAEFPKLGPSPFAAITMFDFIEHVRDPLATLQKAASLLAPGGTLLMCTPNAASLSRRFMRHAWLHYKVEHLYYFTPSSMRAILPRAGLGLQYARRANKIMTPAYITRQFVAYPRPFITDSARLAARLTPGPLRHVHIPIGLGEMVVLARRAS